VNSILTKEIIFIKVIQLKLAYYSAAMLVNNQLVCTPPNGVRCYVEFAVFIIIVIIVIIIIIIIIIIITILKIMIMIVKIISIGVSLRL